MAINEPHRQVEIVNGLSEQVHALAISTREFPNPADTYQLLGALSGAVSGLRQVCAQISSFHLNVQDGIDYAGEDEDGSGQSAQEVADSLAQAASALTAAGRALDQAHAANSHLRWI